MLPLRRCRKPSRAAVRGDPTGEHRLAPPTPTQPAGVCWPLNVPQTLLTVLTLPVQYSAYGVNSSASAETSGISRHSVPREASAHCVVPLPRVLYLLVTPGPAW